MGFSNSFRLSTAKGYSSQLVKNQAKVKLKKNRLNVRLNNLNCLSLLIFKIIREFESIINQVWIFWQGSTSLLKQFIHYTNSLLVCDSKLRVKNVHYILNCLIRYYFLQGFPSKVCLTFRARLSIIVL